MKNYTTEVMINYCEIIWNYNLVLIALFDGVYADIYVNNWTYGIIFHLRKLLVPELNYVNVI